MSAAARQNAIDNLYDVQVGEARALRTARVGGYRGKVFELLGRAARLDTLERDQAELGREASASLGDFAGLEPVVLRDIGKITTAMAIHPRSEWIAVDIGGSTVCLCDPATGVQLARLAETHAGITAMAATPDGRLLVGHADGTIRVVEFEPQSRTLRTTTKPMRSGPIVGFYPVTGGRTKVAFGSPAAITIGDLDEPESVVLDFAHSVPGRSGGHLSSPAFAISPDGRLAAAGLRFPEPPYFELAVWEIGSSGVVRHVALASMSFVQCCAFQP